MHTAQGTRLGCCSPRSAPDVAEAGWLRELSGGTQSCGAARLAWAELCRSLPHCPSVGLALLCRHPGEAEGRRQGAAREVQDSPSNLLLMPSDPVTLGRGRSMGSSSTRQALRIDGHRCLLSHGHPRTRAGATAPCPPGPALQAAGGGGKGQG